uniref:Copine-3 n=1 Tax=Panagrellus redivivus TaxID=6233 RepID=A0A7E4V1A0_PANRE
MPLNIYTRRRSEVGHDKVAKLLAPPTDILGQRRQTDANLLRRPTAEEVYKWAASREQKNLWHKIIRSSSENSIDNTTLPAHVVEQRKKAPRGVETIDDFPSPKKGSDSEDEDRFDPYADFKDFYDPLCFSVNAENFGNWPMAPRREMTSDVPVTRLELTLTAKNLKDRDVFSKSDPLCVVFENVMSKTTNKSTFGEIGRTECVKNCLNPEWNRKILVEYFFEERQQMKFEIYDIDAADQALTSHDFLGRATCDLAEIVAAEDSTLTLPLQDLRNQHGTVTIHAEEVDDGQHESVRFKIHGEKLDKKDFFGKSDPFLNIYRNNDIGGRILVLRTEVIKKTLNPMWQPFTASMRALCKGDKDKEIIFECFDYDNDGGHDLIGVASTTVNKLESGEVTELELINEKKKKKKGSKYKNSGVLKFIEARVTKEYTFLEFIHGGLELDFNVSIDFTASNGPVTLPSSLHYFGQRSNEYQMAVRAVLDICQSYNRTRIFRAYGFGAKIEPYNEVSHLFPLNLQAPEVQGVEGVMNAYDYAIRHTQLYGPTNFAPAINEAAKRAHFERQTRYQILLIITDGVISDMKNTKSAIINASELPLSIIIVGVGQANFDKMDELDADDTTLSVNGRCASRDIVQFVPFQKFCKKGPSSPYEEERLQYLLAKEVLAEVPQQVVSYMKSKGIVPGEPGTRPLPTALPPPAAPSHPYPQVPAPQIGFDASYPAPSEGLPYPAYPPPAMGYAPANPPAYTEAAPDVQAQQLAHQFHQQANVKASAPYM